MTNPSAETAPRPWHEFTPAEAVNLGNITERDDVQGPYNENGEECPWPWDPIQLKGAPLGQYRCRYCGAMVMAGMDHLDYGAPEDGRTWLDRAEDEQRNPPETTGA